MTLEFGLLLLESVLLLATVIMLIYGIHEGKRREDLLQEIGKATRVLTRQEYFFSITEAMFDAQQEILGCITGRPPLGADVGMTRHIADAIAHMTKKGVNVKYLLPKFPDRLQIGVQYTKAGAEVSFSSCLTVHNLRYTVVDGKTVVLGIPESTGEREATRKGYTIPSAELAGILRNYFIGCEDQTSLKDYLQEVLKQTGATLDHLAREFHVDVSELRQFAQ